MEWLDILACPICSSCLQQNDALYCENCEESFPMAAGSSIPSFINRRQYSSDEEYEYAKKIINFWGLGWEQRIKDDEHSYIYDLDSSGIDKFVTEVCDRHQKSRALFGREIPLTGIDGKVILNIGCGAGTESLVLAKKRAICIAMDITAQAANAADLLIKRSGSSGFGIQADARFLPLKSASIDYCYSSGVLHHSPDIQRSIQEVWRVLKPGGVAGIMLYATYSPMFLTERIPGIISGMFSKKHRDELFSARTEGAWRTGENGTNPFTKTFSMRECKNIFSGFSSISIRKGSFSFNQIWGLSKLLKPEQLLGGSSFDSLLGPCIYIGARK